MKEGHELILFKLGDGQIGVLYNIFSGCCSVAKLCLTLLRPHGLQPARLLRFPRQEYWSGLPFPSLGDLANPGIELVSPALTGGFFITEPPGKPIANQHTRIFTCSQSHTHKYTFFKLMFGVESNSGYSIVPNGLKRMTNKHCNSSMWQEPSSALYIRHAKHTLQSPHSQTVKLFLIACETLQN